MNTERKEGKGDDPFDGDLARRYHEASAKLGERPSASARASILAAAAREVEAQPIDSIAAYRRHRPRWPLAVAATVMLSTLAVMLAIRTGEEMPQFSPPNDSVVRTEKPAPVAPPAPSAIEEQRNQAAAQPAERVQTEKAQPLRRSSEPVSARAKRESDVVADKPSEARSSTPAASPFPQAPVASTPPAPPAPPSSRAPSTTPKLRVDESEAGVAAQSRSLDQASADARRDAARNAAPAPSVASNERAEATDAAEPASMWLERIIKLRRDGKIGEADTELKRFRERYPQVQVPAEALPLTGTR